MNRVLILLVLLATASLMQAQTASEQLSMVFGPDHQPEFQVNAFEALTARSLPVERDGVRLERAGEQGVLVRSSRRPVSFQFARVRGSIPPDATAILELAEDAFDLRSVAGNNSPFHLTLPDGATADLRPGSTGRVEIFDDGTYSFLGSDGVTARSADGLPVNFSRHTSPLVGGELKEVISPAGDNRFVRATPVIHLEFSGGPLDEVRLGDRILVPDQERLFSFPNGTKIFLTHDRARALVLWRVMKGVAHVTVAGFSCWRATVLSGQEGALQWNTAGRLLDLKYASEGGSPVVVQLSGRINASVMPGATFQYAQFQDCGSFSTAALGDVSLHDHEAGETIPIEQRAVSYNEGLRVGGQAVRGKFHQVSLAWEKDDRIVLRRSADTFPIRPGLEQTVAIDTEKLRVNYGTDAGLTVRALQGNFTIQPAFVPGFEVEVPEGGELRLTLNRQRLTFVAEAISESAATLRVLWSGKTYMHLSGNARAVVILGQNSLVPEASPAWVFFEGAGSDTTFASQPQPGRLIAPGRINGDRIPQEPVSILK